MSKIQWTDKTWNPVRGCSIVSPGCVHCYAMKQAHRFSGPGKPYEGLTKLTKAGPQWTGKVVCDDAKLLEPLSWRKPCRVFVNSMSDLFHEDVPFDFIDKVFAVMALAPRHTFQILTKRAERMRAYLAAGQFRDVYVADAAKRLHTKPRPFALPDERIFDAQRVARGESWLINAWPLPNVWLGVSCEDQPRADERIPLLLQTPAAVRFVSAEPLLDKMILAGEGYNLRQLDWVIVGGESGSGARPCDLAWVRSIVQQCKAAGVSCFVKQLGSKPEVPQKCGDCDPCLAGQRCYQQYNVLMDIKDRKGGDPAEWPEDLRVRNYPEATP